VAQAVVTMKIMPESPDVDLDGVKDKAIGIIAEFAGPGDVKTDIEPIAFGLKALLITFVMPEELGSPDALENDITAIEGVNSFEITDVRRAIG